MPTSRIPVPSSLQQARLLMALLHVLPYAESRAEDLAEHKAAGQEDPECPGADEAWARVNAAQELVASVQPADWVPAVGDWVCFDNSEDDAAESALAQVLGPGQMKDSCLITVGGAEVLARRCELKLLARPTEAESGGMALIAESPTDPLNANNYFLQVPEGTDGEAVWISIGNAALQLRVHGENLTVSSHPNGDEDSATWDSFVVEDALAASSRPAP